MTRMIQMTPEETEEDKSTYPKMQEITHQDYLKFRKSHPTVTIEKTKAERSQRSMMLADSRRMILSLKPQQYGVFQIEEIGQPIKEIIVVTGLHTSLAM